MVFASIQYIYEVFLLKMLVHERYLKNHSVGVRNSSQMTQICSSSFEFGTCLKKLQKHLLFWHEKIKEFIVRFEKQTDGYENWTRCQIWVSFCFRDYYFSYTCTISPQSCGMSSVGNLLKVTANWRIDGGKRPMTELKIFLFRNFIRTEKNGGLWNIFSNWTFSK